METSGGTPRSAVFTSFDLVRECFEKFLRIELSCVCRRRPLCPMMDEIKGQSSVIDLANDTQRSSEEIWRPGSIFYTFGAPLLPLATARARSGGPLPPSYTTGLIRSDLAMMFFCFRSTGFKSFFFKFAV